MQHMQLTSPYRTLAAIRLWSLQIAVLMLMGLFSSRALASEIVWQTLDREAWHRLELQQYAHAQRLFEQCCQESAPATDKGYRQAISQTGLAWAREQQHQYQAARDCAQQALAVLKTITDDSRQKVILARCHHVIGKAQHGLACLPEAATALELARTLYLALPSERENLILATLELARIKVAQCAMQIAMQRFDEAFTLSRDPRQQQQIVVEKADLFTRVGRYSSAAQLFLVWDRIHGSAANRPDSQTSSHTETLTALMAFARIHTLRGAHADANSLFQRIEQEMETHPPQHPRVQADICSLRIRQLIARGDLVTAELKLWELCPSPDCDLSCQGEIKAMRGDIAFMKGDYSRAEHWYDQARQDAEATYGLQHSLVWDLTLRRGFAAQYFGDRQKVVKGLAEYVLYHIYETCGARLANQHPLTGRALHLLGFHAYATHDYLRSQALTERAVTILSVTQAETDHDRLLAELDLATARWTNTDYDIARQLVQGVLPFTQTEGCAPLWLRAKAFTLLGFIEHSSGKTHLAIQNFLCAEQLWNQVPRCLQLPVAHSMHLVTIEEVHPGSADTKFGIALASLGMTPEDSIALLVKELGKPPPRTPLSDSLEDDPPEAAPEPLPEPILDPPPEAPTEGPLLGLNDVTARLTLVKLQVLPPPVKLERPRPDPSLVNLLYLYWTTDRLLLRLPREAVAYEMSRRAAVLKMHGRKREALVIYAYTLNLYSDLSACFPVSIDYLQQICQKITELQIEVSQPAVLAE